MSAPLYNRLRAYARQKRTSFAMPGHKNGCGLKRGLLSLDVTELDATENLYRPREYVREACRLLADAYKSSEAYILTGGSTAAIQAMICAALKEGETLLADSDCHMSIINTCAVFGYKLRFIPRDFDTELAATRPIRTVKEYLGEDIRAVIITSPTFYGVCSDIKNIAAECHERGIPLLVDEAHGAHFIADRRFPETAAHFADAVCESAHKTLNALNGAAYLHLNGTLLDRERCRAAIAALQSSSPSYVIAASADIARDELCKKNGWARAYDRCIKLRDYAVRLGIRALENDDMTRVVLNLAEYDLTGIEAGAFLSDRKIDIEMADLFNIVLIVTPYNTARDLRRVKRALKKITEIYPKHAKKPIPPPRITDKTLSPRDVFFKKRTAVKLTDAAGKTASVSVTPYPPGIPVIHMGETVSAEQAEYIMKLLSSGAEVAGLEDGSILTAELQNE